VTTDFFEYSNLRLLIPRPAAAPLNFREGVPAGVGHWLIHAFARGPASGAPELPSIAPRTIVVAGYITAWADLPAGADWLAAAGAFSWDTTGLAPAALRMGMSGRGFLGDLQALPVITGPAITGEASITALGGLYGPGGIGAELRADVGDAITVELQAAA